MSAVRACVILNPTAHKGRAGQLLEQIRSLPSCGKVVVTQQSGTAPSLGSQAVRERFDLIVAAGGDGTIDEVVNGIARVDGGLERTALGILPIGTVNGLALEYGIPFELRAAWEIVLRRNERKIDLPHVTCESSGQTTPYYFTHLASAGMEARVQHLVRCQRNGRRGKLAYVLAAIRVVNGSQKKIRISTPTGDYEGETVLIGNGRLYGGRAVFFPNARPNDGLLDLRIIPRIRWIGLISNFLHIRFHGACHPKRGYLLQAESFRLSAPPDALFQVGGEFVGSFPAQFSVNPGRLRLIVP